MFPDISRSALRVWERHLEPLGPHLVVVALADPQLDSEVKERMGRRLLQQMHLWHPGIEPQLPRGVTTDSQWWEVPEGEEGEGQPREPSLDEFITPASFRFFHLLNWEPDRVEFMAQPYETWQDSEDYRNFCTFVNGSLDDGIDGVSFVNDRSERYSAGKSDAIMCSEMH